MPVADERADKLRCMVDGCCCCYDACDFNNPILCFKGSDDCLCFRSSCCLAANTPHKGCGCTGEESRGECCKIGCFCCDVGLVKLSRATCCGYAWQFLCCYSVGSLPCNDEYVPKCVCTLCCCLQLAPQCGCCVAPPPSPALDKILNNKDLYVPGQHMERK